MQEADSNRLRHMIDAAAEIITFTEQVTLKEFQKDRKLQLSIIHLLEIIGEAGSQISNDITSTYPDIPWKSIIGMRNRLIHGYFDVDLVIVWNTATQDIPTLLHSLQRILESQ